MAIVAGFDVHRRQITFDALDTDSGEVSRGRIDATPAAVSAWVGRTNAADVKVAVEACTGWLFVCDALVAAGAVSHLAEPVETRALRGRKRRAYRRPRRQARRRRPRAPRRRAARGISRRHRRGLTAAATCTRVLDRPEPGRDASLATRSGHPRDDTRTGRLHARTRVAHVRRGPRRSLRSARL